MAESTGLLRRLSKCPQCVGEPYGCDCGACGVIYPGSYGYEWCATFKGCPMCGSSGRAWPWQRRFWLGLYWESFNHWPMYAIVEWRGDRRVKKGEE